MFCSNCGTENTEGSAFCVSCGKKLISSEKQGKPNLFQKGLGLGIFGKEVKDMTQGMMQGINSGIQNIKQQNEERNVAKREIEQYVKENIELMSETEVFQLSKITILKYDYFAKRMGTKYESCIKTAGHNNSFEGIKINASPKERDELEGVYNATLLPLIQKIQGHEKYSIFETVLLFENELGKYILSSVKEVIKAQTIDKYGEEVVNRIIDGTSNLYPERFVDIKDDDIYAPYNCYFISKFSEDKLNKFDVSSLPSVIGMKYDRKIKIIKDVTDREMVYDIVSDMDLTKYLIWVDEGILKLLAMENLQVRNIETAVSIIANQYLEIKVDDIDFFKVEGEYHRDAITSGGGTDYLMTGLAGRNKLGGFSNFQKDIKTEIKVEDTRRIILTTKKGNYYFTYDSLTSLQHQIPQKESDIVKDINSRNISSNYSTMEEKKSDNEDIMVKFEKLKNLKEMGLISDEEYEKKRQELVSKI